MKGRFGMHSWSTKKLSDVVEKIQTGSTPSTKRSEFFDGDIQWFTPSDLGKSKFLSKSERTITKQAITEGQAKLFPQGTLLVTCIGNIGRVGLTPALASSNQQITGLKFNENINPSYAYYWFLKHQPLLEKWANQAVVPIINNERLLELDFHFPSLDEQRRIAKILDQAARLRRLRRHARQLTDTFLQSVFIEMFGDLTKFDSIELGDELHKIESGWSPVCDEAFTTSKQWGVLSLSAVSHGRYSDKDVKALPLSQAPKEHLEVKPRDFLVTRKNTKELVGACAIVHRTRPMVMIPDKIFRFQLKQEKILPEYLWGLFNEQFFRKKIQSMATGSAGSMPNISKEKFGELRIPAPPQHLQKQFARILNAIETQTTIEREAERQAELNFQALLHRAFTGQLVLEAIAV